MTSLEKIFSALKPSLLFGTMCIIISWNCSNPRNPGMITPNVPPKTRLSNVPSLDTVTRMPNPLVTLNWVGDDPDGFVVGFKYAWTNRINGIDSIKPWNFILNINVGNFALIVVTQNEKIMPSVYKYFATLPQGVGLGTERTDSLARGDSIWVEGVRVFASNSDSIKIATGRRVKYNANQWVHKNPNTGTFIIDSPEKINFHIFKVAAIDNEGASSTFPATVSFETPQVVAPHTRITDINDRSTNSQAPPDTFLVISDSTATFPGLLFKFQGIDPNSRSLDYRWVVDKDQWLARTGKIPWTEFSPAESAYVQAADFPDPYATDHIFYVQSRNEFKVIDTIGWVLRIQTDQNHDSIGVQIDSAWYKFQTIYPAFKRTDLPPNNRILFINNSVNGEGTPVNPSYRMIDTFYLDALTKNGIPRENIDFYRAGKDSLTQKAYRFPSKGMLSNYHLVIYCIDHLSPSYTADYSPKGQAHYLNKTVEKIIRDYCFIGGNIIFSGWAMTGAMNMQSDDDLPTKILHINYGDNKVINLVYDCIGANGQIGYRDIRVDPAKLDTSWHGALKQIWTAYPVGFGEIIYKYASLTGDLSRQEIPIGIRYQGITFNSIYFDFPLYYMQRQDVEQSLGIALQDVLK